MTINVGDPLGGASELVKATAGAQRPTTGVLLQRAADQGYLDEAARLKAEVVTLKQRRKRDKAIKRITRWMKPTDREELIATVNERMAQIPPEERQPPRPNVLVPAVEAMAYNWDEIELRDMYLNLIQRSSDAQTASDVHPSFVDIIRHLSSAEVQLLDLILSMPDPWAAVKLVMRAPNGVHREVEPLVLHLVDVTGAPLRVSELPVWAANWQRLGLVTISFDRRKFDGSGADPYGWTGMRPEWIDMQQLRAPTGGAYGEGEWVPDFQKGVLEATPFGRAFHAVVRAPVQSES